MNTRPPGGRTGRLSGLDPRLLKGAPPAVVILVLIISGVSYWLNPTTNPATPSTGKKQTQRLPTTAPTSVSSLPSIDDVIRDQRSGVMVESSGAIKKVLPDDQDGDRHQRFIVTLPSGSTVLIAHNIDLAPRVPLKERDAIEFHGQFEWSEQGGTVHWTHHDPAGRREGGWIRHHGKLYE